jgi:hypothetical protein
MNILGRNNSMEIPYSFIWTAIFEDESKLTQYDFITGKETLFKDVLFNLKNLKKFILWNTNQAFIVDIEKGIISLNTNPDNLIEVKNRFNKRLIFFRRHIVKLTENLNEKFHDIEYHLGLQYNDEHNNNHKIILIIDKNGNWVIGA